MPLPSNVSGIDRRTNSSRSRGGVRGYGQGCGMKKRLLIFSADYGSDQLPTIFLRSARQAGVQADIVLLRHKSDPEVEQELQRYYPATFVFAPLRHELLRVVRRA